MLRNPTEAGRPPDHDRQERCLAAPSMALPVALKRLVRILANQAAREWAGKTATQIKTPLSPIFLNTPGSRPDREVKPEWSSRDAGF